MRHVIFWAACLVLILAAPAAVAADAGSAQITSQARYWEQKGRYDLAREAWRKLLRANPDDETALAGLAAAEIRSGRPAQAQPHLQALRRLRPDHPDLRRIEAMLATGAVSGEQLARARELARAGRYDDAVAEYRRVFGGETPDGALAQEYWQTLAGAEGGWTAARAGLEQLLRDRPDDPDHRLALAQHLTYREETRRQGIEQLIALAEADAGRQPVQAAWRQALLWLGTRPGDTRYFQAYLRRYGDDTQVSTRLAAGRGGGAEVARGGSAAKADVRGLALQRAWKLVDAGDIAAAEQVFSDLIRRNRGDVDALAGLGVIRLRQDRFADARQLLQQASRLAPRRASLWREALTAASFWEQVRLAQTEVKAGDLGSAEQRLRQASSDAPQIAASEPSVRLTLADIVLAQGRSAEAEVMYRDVLRREPDNLDATRGLMTALAGDGRSADALALYGTLNPAQQERIGSVGAIQSRALRQQAAQALAADDTVSGERLLQQALVADPLATWPRLDLARLYLASNRQREARGLIDGLPTAGPLRGETSHIRALMAAEEQNWYDGLMWLEQVPETERGAAMSALQQRLWVRYQTERAAVYARQGYRGEALALLAGVEPYAASPELVGSVSLAYDAADEQGRGLYLLRRALSSSPDPAPDLRLAYAGMLLKLGQDAEFDAVMEPLSRLPALNRQQEGVLTELRITQRLRQADTVRQTGDLARAYELLEPALHANPDDARLIMALARLYDQAEEYERSAALYRYAAGVDERNLDAYQGAVQAHLALGNEAEADRWLEQALRMAPDSGRLHALAGRVARARGEEGRALAFYRRALELGPDSGATPPGALRLQMLDPNLRAVRSERPERPSARFNPALRGDRALAPRSRFSQGRLIRVATRPADPGSKPAEQSPAKSSGTKPLPPLPPLLPPGYQLPKFDAQPSTPPRLDGRRSFVPPPLGPAPLNLRLDPTLGSRDYAREQPLVADSATGEVLREIAEITSQRSAWVAGGLALRNRDGTPGLDRLDDIELPLELSLAAPGAGRFTLAVVPVYLDAGTVSGSALPLFGTLAELPVFDIDPAGRSVDQNDEGVAVGAGYETGSLRLDFGSSPLGFEISNLVGGLRWQPRAGPWVFDIDLSRRAITDSLLSYAGSRDPLSGVRWGGVTATGGRVNVAYDWGTAGLYVNGAYQVYDGRNVADNNRSELGGGAYLHLVQTPLQRFTVGLNLTTFYFDDNLRRFSLGHGGYFSPQRYVSLALPAEWSGGHTRYSWKINAAIGLQNFREDGAALYPDDAGRQARIEQFADVFAEDDPPILIATGYAGQSSNSVGIGFGGQFEYLLAPRLVLGARGAFDNARDYDESRVQAYLRFALSRPQAVAIPPRPVIPFSEFGKFAP